MPNVPTTTPGPDDTEHTLEDVTETIPLITNVHAESRADARTMRPRFPMKRHMPSSRQNVPNVDAKSSSDAALRPASWPPLCSSPLS